jgi:hypothetical protein
MPKGQYSSRSAMQRAVLENSATAASRGSKWVCSRAHRPFDGVIEGGSMKRLKVLGLIICLIGCTTLQPVPGSPAALQQRIASGELLKRGDHVDILTKDGRTHDFNVTSVSASTIDGKHESISIDQVAFIQKRKLSAGRTALAVGLTVVVTAVVVTACIVGRCRTSAGPVSRRPVRFAQPFVPAPPPPLLLPVPPQTPQLQNCTDTGSESERQVDGGESALTPRCAT